MKSILETLRHIFPLIVADNIYYFLIINQKTCINLEFFNKLVSKNTNKFRNILNIKSNVPAFWLVNFEKVYIENNLFTSKNIDNFYKGRKQILIDNHLFLKNWRKRQKQRKLNKAITS